MRSVFPTLGESSIDYRLGFWRGAQGLPALLSCREDDEYMLGWAAGYDAARANSIIEGRGSSNEA